MNDSSNMAVKRTLMLPLTLLFSAIAVNYMLSLLSFLFGWMQNPGLSRIILTAAYVTVSTLFWIVCRTGNRRRFHELAIAGCLVLVGINLYGYFFSGEAPGFSVAYRLFWIVADMPLIALCFLLRLYRPSFRGGTEKAKDIFPFLGALYIMWGALGFLFAFLEIGQSDPGFLLRPIVQIIVGFGILRRDGFFGLFGSFCLIILPFLTQRPPFQISGAAGMVTLVQRVLVPATIFIMLLLRKDEGFIRNTARHLFPVSGANRVKTCSGCGKQVPPSAAAGQRCPHCGAYWSAEHTRRQ